MDSNGFGLCFLLKLNGRAKASIQKILPPSGIHTHKKTETISAPLLAGLLVAARVLRPSHLTKNEAMPTQASIL